MIIFYDLDQNAALKKNFFPMLVAIIDRYFRYHKYFSKLHKENIKILQFFVMISFKILTKMLLF